MATYNGERFLAQQIDSIVRQTCQDWHLYIHDDGSKDQTTAIIRHYECQHPDKITQLDYGPQGGAMNNFLSMLQRVESPYYMFCDQDDVWLEDKVKTSLEEMKELEERYRGIPIVVYTDLCVTDEALNVTNPSLWQEICLYPDFVTDFDHIAATTAVTGCAMLFNQKAKDAIVFPATYATMHDAWIAACVLKQGGKIHPVRKQTVYYRQHEKNCVGAADLNHLTLAYRIKHFTAMQGKNWRLYTMLRSLGYGSVLKFIRYKMKYKQFVKQKNTRQ
jgi:glycosyltransferase involved in cell wall biosynthesis